MGLAAGGLVQSVYLNAIPGVAPKTTSSTGTTTSGTTETFDAVLGYYQFTALANTRYMAIANGFKGGGNTTADLYGVRIRDSGTSSNPISTDTLVAETAYYVPVNGGPGQAGIPALAGSFFVTTAGVHTLGVSATRFAGTGTLNLIGTRELFVIAIGGV